LHFVVRVSSGGKEKKGGGGGKRGFYLHHEKKKKKGEDCLLLAWRGGGKGRKREHAEMMLSVLQRKSSFFGEPRICFEKTRKGAGGMQSGFPSSVRLKSVAGEEGRNEGGGGAEAFLDS